MLEKKYLTGCDRELFSVNWIQYYIGQKIIIFIAWLFRMNIAVGEGRCWYGKKPNREEST